MKRFVVPENYRDVAVDILSDPLILLEKLLTDKPDKIYNPIVKGYDYVILPLYSTKQKGEVSEKSGLNQWNAGGRLRNVNEVYIPVPVKIHQLYPDFFPPKDQPFELQLPDGKKLSAKICQANGKALMSNPNSDLGEWLLRKILKKKEGSLVTKFDLDTFGFDSIMVVNTHKVNEAGLKIFRLEFTENQNNFQEFIK